MSKTLAEIGYSIRNQVKGYYSTDDERIDIQLIYDKCWDVRAVLLKDEFRQFKKINDQDFTTECCLEVQCGSIVCNGMDSGVQEYYVEIPKVESALGYDAIKYFGTVDKATPFRRGNYQSFLYSGHEKYTGKVPFFTIVDDKAILKNLPTKGLKFVCMIGVLEDPRNICNEDDPFPIARHLVHKLELLVIQQLMSTLNIGPDENNDARDSSPQQLQKQSRVE
jgi:hypothetical protein